MVPSTITPACMIFTVNKTSDCEHCIPGYYLDAGSCEICPYSCTACDSSTVCVECIPGFYLENSTCLPCEFPCVTCESPTECLSCGALRYLSGTTCEKCSEEIVGCSECLNGTYCQTCELSFFLESSQLSCTPCTSPCASCNSSS